eukprot:TRINITY_DN31793_c0_g1_i1.p2 TRINITY_DN31793_c0_g1~~TRINITY_DN31793_c0_g1_i1.p2  ORF type:complete len:123 (+),score=31.54 TRINITY_DN31793_c0_g1_i1:58-426(+)
MGHSIRSKKKRKFRNIKRQQAAPMEEKKLNVLINQLDEIRGAEPQDRPLPEPGPVRFVHKLPLKKFNVKPKLLEEDMEIEKQKKKVVRIKPAGPKKKIEKKVYATPKKKRSFNKRVRSIRAH